MRSFVGLLILFGWCSVISVAPGDVSGERVFFLNGTTTLQGCVFKPAGKGPFPAVIFNEGVLRPVSDAGAINPFPALAKFYTSRGYVLFLPGRRKDTLAETDASKNKKEDPEAADKRWKAIQDYHLEYVVAGLNWLKAQSYVDEKRVFMTGFGSAGITTLLASQQDLGVRGYVSFSAAALLWPTNESVQRGLTRAVERSHAPIFLIQLANDRSIKPLKVLSGILETKGDRHRSKIYPATAPQQPREANRFATEAVDVWGEDVLAFFENALR